MTNAAMVFFSLGLYAQNPAVFSVDKLQAAAGEVVTIQGSDFGNDPAGVNVFFGGAKAEIKSVRNGILEVRTPFGATFDPIRVANTTTGRSAAAPGQFFVNYQGESGITSAKFSVQLDFQAQSGLYDLCLCDFDGDNKVDVATASNTSSLVTVFRNTSSPGNISLEGQDVQINARTLHVKCGDLNGDGRCDIVLSEASDGSRVFILTNNGGFNFSLQSITLPDIKVKQIGISDLDLDGRQDLVVTNTGGNVIAILPNTSATTATSFGTPVSVSIPEASSTDALAVGDLDADGYPEIVTSQYQTDSENKLFILRNQGSFDFSDVRVIAVNKAVSSIRIADLDADSKPDLAIARLTGSDISVYLHNTASSLSFKEPLFFITETLPVGMDFSDFDGDGKLDIAVGSIAKSVSVLNNTTTSTGTATFAPVVKINATYVNRHLRNADLDGDGKPDIVFTSIDDFSGVPAPSSKVSVLRNLSCMVPRITPGGPLKICTGSEVQLKATAGGGVTYQWFIEGNGNPVKSGTENFLNVTTPGTYKVIALSGPPTCSHESAVVDVAFLAPATTLSSVDPDARSNSPVCTDNSLVLRLNDVGATAYRWRGPGGYSETVTTNTLERSSFAMEQAGLYTVEILSGTCVAKTDSTLVEPITIPDFAIHYNGVAQFCSDGSKALEVTPILSSGFTYQWYEQASGAIAGATSARYTASSSGEYYAVITPGNPGCTPKQTTTVKLAALTPPTAAFQAAESGCAGNEISFIQQSSGDPETDLAYSWTFGNGKISEDAGPTNVYEQANTFEVTLKVSYPGIEACSSTVSKLIEVFSPVSPQIIASASAICEGDSISLSIENTFMEINWSTGENEREIYVRDPGTYTVTTLDLHGCISSDEKTIAEKTLPQLELSANPPVIAAGQTAQLQVSGADTFLWSPGKTLNDSTIANPIASPVATTTYVVTGSLTDGCTNTGMITVQVSGEVVNVSVPVLFSPNGDEVNQTLIIEGVENYPDCSLSIFDRRGGRVFRTAGYKNNWDGTVKGTPLPDGVYYYIFGCPNGKAMTGTVTIIR